MKSLIRFFTLVIMLSARVVQAAGDPLPSCNAGPAKDTVLQFVRDVKTAATSLRRLRAWREALKRKQRDFRNNLTVRPDQNDRRQFRI